MKDRVLYLDGTTSTINVEEAYELTQFDKKREIYVLSYKDKNFIWCNNTWMEE